MSGSPVLGLSRLVLVPGVVAVVGSVGTAGLGSRRRRSLREPQPGFWGPHGTPGPLEGLLGGCSSMWPAWLGAQGMDAGGLGARPHTTPVASLSEPQCPCLPTPRAPLGSGRFQRSGEVPGVRLGPQPLGEASMSGSAPAGGAHQGSQVLPGDCLSHEPHPRHARGGALPQHF